MRSFEELKALKRLQEQRSHREGSSHQNLSPLIESSLGERKREQQGGASERKPEKQLRLNTETGSARQTELVLRWEITGR